MRRLSLLLLSLMLFVILPSVVESQSTPTDNAPLYHLHVPTAEEYFDELSKITWNKTSQYDSVGRSDPFVSTTIDMELFVRYPELYQVSSATLIKAARNLGVGSAQDLFFRRDRWNQTIIHAWLIENHIDLNKVATLQIGDFLIEVLPRDFDGDGIDEFLLRVAPQRAEDYQGCGSRYLDYLIVQQRGENYDFIGDSLPEFGRSSSYRSGDLLELDFQDLNQDGLPEWILVQGGITFGAVGEGYLNTGRLYIINWRDHQLVDLIPSYEPGIAPDEQLRYEEDEGTCSDATPRSVSWEFTNIDRDAELEIVQKQLYQDNWDCQVTVTRNFDWNTSQDRFIFLNTERELTDSWQCNQRQAEEALWKHDYQTAIRLFEQAIAIYQPEIDINVKYQYLRTRLALAYIQTGEIAKARALLASLTLEEISSEPVQRLVSALYKHIDDPQSACIEAYNVFTTHYPDLYLGTTLEHFEVIEHPYLPEHIGCDAPSLISQLLSSHSFSLDRSPVEQLQILGLSVRKSIILDLNQDGRNEWLIWLKTSVAPIFFAPDIANARYQVSRPDMGPLLRSYEFSIQASPEETGQMLVYSGDEIDHYYMDVPVWSTVYDRINGFGGGYYCSTPGRKSNQHKLFWIWHIRNNKLVRIFNGQLCQGTANAIFPNGSNILDGGIATYEDVVNFSRSLLYRWDATTETYVPMPVILDNPDSTPAPVITPSPVPEFPYRSPYYAVESGDFETALQMTEVSLANTMIEEDEDYLKQLHYSRAFTLEMLNHPDEALAEYISIYESAPDSPWAILAALHLEKVAQ